MSEQFEHQVSEFERIGFTKLKHIIEGSYEDGALMELWHGVTPCGEEFAIIQELRCLGKVLAFDHIIFSRRDLQIYIDFIEKGKR